jgi:hypothetical protein
MTLTVSTKTYTQDRIQADSILYTGPANTLSIKDTIELKRVYPKPTSDFAGVARPTIKMVRTFTLADSTKADAIVTISASLPVGITTTDADLLIDDVVSFMQLEAADTTKVIKNLDITH